MAAKGKGRREQNNLRSQSRLWIRNQSPSWIATEFGFSFLFLFSLLKLTDFTSAVKAASKLSPVNIDQYIQLATPGLNKYGPNITIFLTALIALIIGSRRNARNAPHKGSMTIALTVPGVSIALSGMMLTFVWAAIGAIVGLIFTSSKHGNVRRSFMHVVIWVVVAGVLFWLALLFARA